MKNVVFQFEHFGFQYKAQAEPTLKDINLSIREGEKVLICGPSGCGKSTLAHCMNGLIPNSYKGTMTGELRIDGRSCRELDIFTLSKLVGTVLQDSDGQFIGLSVGEDIAFALENDCAAQNEMKQRVAETAELVGVDRLLEQAPHSLSGGQKQRVSLAGVMVDDVKVLLFDEPLANLDPAAGKTVIELIDEIHRRTGVTVIIIEHRLEDVLHRSVDRVILMREGQICADRSPDELLAEDLLRPNGIREPLYVTALRYAGVEITAERQPGRMDTLRLSEAEKEQVRNWYRSIPEAESAVREEILLEAEHVRFGYESGRPVVKDLNFTLRRGEMVALVGRNGAGKSTFSKLICGFEQPWEGCFRFQGEDMADATIRERAEHIGYVMQNPNQMISQNLIFDEVGLGLRMAGMEPELIKKNVHEALKICGLYPFRKWPVSALSYGQKKRVTVASVLAMKPEIIILDEPTAGQDFRHYTDIMEFLRELNRQGVTILMITHDMHLMLEYCERAAVFSDGEKIADAGCADILTDAEIVERASLKETSLSALARLCGLEPGDYIRSFIRYDREVRRHDESV